MSSVLLLFFIFNFLAAVWGRWDLSSLTRDRNGVPQHWKYGVLTTGSLGKSRSSALDLLNLMY